MMAMFLMLSAVLILDFVPYGVHLFQRCLAQAGTTLRENLLHPTKAPVELVDGAAQGVLRYHTHEAGDVDEGEEQITELVGEGFYDGVVFHRVIPGFMAQGGDPTGTGMGGSDKPDLKAEFNAEPHVRGTCSMARTQVPDSANSQFFICFDDAHFLDGQYTVWGQVESGMEHVDALPKGEPPKEPGKIVKATVS